MAIRFAKDGANIAVLAKTITKHPKLPGTIHSAAEEIKKVGGKALAIQCDIRYEDQVKSSIQKVV
jgi:citronellol/citronellal dehydrogenase